MSLFLEAPDSNLKVEADFRGGSRGDPLFAFRVLFGKNAVTGWCGIARKSASESKLIGAVAHEVDEDVPVRVKSRHGVVVVREGVYTLRDSAGRPFRLRIAQSDGCVVISSSSKKYAPRLAMPSAFSCGYALSASGKIYRLAKAAVESGECSSALLFFSHGRAAAFMRRHEDGAVELDVASRPAELVVPRRLAAEVQFSDCGTVDSVRDAALASFNVRDLYLRGGRASSDAFFADNRLSASPVELEPGGVTPMHDRAMAVLASSAYDGSTGFRGEFGEYFCMARRAGDVWTVAAVTVKMRVLTLFFPFLDDGVEYMAEWALDENSALPDNIEDVTPAVVKAGCKAVVKMPPFGGFVLKLTKKTPRQC